MTRQEWYREIGMRYEHYLRGSDPNFWPWLRAKCGEVACYGSEDDVHELRGGLLLLRQRDTRFRSEIESAVRGREYVA